MCDRNDVWDLEGCVRVPGSFHHRGDPDETLDRTADGGEPHTVAMPTSDGAPQVVTRGSPEVAGCDNSCEYPSDGWCDDGGPGAESPTLPLVHFPPTCVPHGILFLLTTRACCLNLRVQAQNMTSASRVPTAMTAAAASLHRRQAGGVRSPVPVFTPTTHDDSQ